MTKRSDHYYGDRGLKMYQKDTDGKMYFKTVESAEALERNFRSQLCLTYTVDELENLPDDMVLVILQKQEGLIMFYEKWRIYYADELNIVRDAKDVKIYVPYKDFKSIGGHSWVDFNGDNITWENIKEYINVDEPSHGYQEQIPLFKYAIKQSGEPK